MSELGVGAAALGSGRMGRKRGHHPGGFATSVLQGLAPGKMAHLARDRAERRRHVGKKGLLRAG